MYFARASIYMYACQATDRRCTRRVFHLICHINYVRQGQIGSFLEHAFFVSVALATMQSCHAYLCVCDLYFIISILKISAAAEPIEEDQKLGGVAKLSADAVQK